MTAHTTKTSHRIERIRFWWRASAEIHELTRDHDREERIIAEAAIRLSPGPSNIAWLFRRGPARLASKPSRGDSTRTTSN
uniref:Uncharacterized protein n=1 Tax=Neobacillus citreus TaxID=2833578 RepID=A0A942T020_9BACI